MEGENRRSDIPRPPIASAAVSIAPDPTRYRLEDLIGRGGMGSVYRAHDTLRGRDVAWKRLELPEPSSGAALTDPQSRAARKTLVTHESRQHARRRAQMIALFQREYHTLAQLAHPRIIEVYDYGLFDGLPYYTMELLEGRDLSKAGPVPWQRACSILRDVASALTLLHARRMLHRDVSPRNVLCAPSGHAKLIDFGAMTPMGLSSVLVGTPAFVAPEAVQRQALDARSDLYSLGALAYLLLSGRPPYMAHGFADLRDAYRTRPLPPSVYAPDVPSALDALVMQLIQIDRAARPGSAVELVERLGALAGLEHDPRLAVAGAYLSTPTLVGRQTELLAVRRRALRAQRGHGASLLAFGPSGVGRSRFLDACALEGKLAGALVLRADPAASGGAEYGVMRSLLTQVHAALSHAERAAHELPRVLSERLVPGMLWRRASARPDSLWPRPALDDDTAVLAQALHDYFIGLAGQRALMILTDDFHAIDGHSAAVLAGLAQATIRCKLVLVSAYETHTALRAEAASRLLEQYSRPLPLGPLQAPETETLLRSVFGNVPNLSVVANRLHGLSAGKPSLCMELARHLVDSGVVRYEAGGFVLPERLHASDLPGSLEQMLQQRFDRLSRSARELGATLALCAGAPLTVAQCLSLTSAQDAAERQRALAELVAAETVVTRDEYLTLRQNAFGAALLAGLSETQVKAIHARLAVFLSEEVGLRVRAAAHFLHAGQPAAALDLLIPAQSDEVFYEWFAGYDALIERALVACEQLGRPPLHAFLLRRGRAYHCMQYLERCDRQQLLDYAAELERMSGLTHYRALGAELAPEQRLVRALELVSAEYAATPERDRIYSPLEAITELSSYLSALAGYGCATFDWQLLTGMPSLEPYVALSPAIEFVEMLCSGLRDLRAGRHEGYFAALESLLERLDRPDGAGLPEARRRATRLSLLFVAALTDGALGRARAFERAAELEVVPRMRGNAWRVRQIAHLYRGDVHQADECRRQVELLLIQDNERQLHQGTTLETEFMCYALSDDLLGLRRAVPELEQMAAQHPGWQPVLLLARAELERIRGRFDTALSLGEQALALMRPGEHNMWPYAAAFHVQALVEAGRAAEAKAIGVPYLATCAQHRIHLLSHNLRMSVAQAELALGENSAVLARMQPALADLERANVLGLYAGKAYEICAHAALALGDAQRFAEYFEHCSTNYGSALDSPFTSRLARLRAKASSAGAAETRPGGESPARPGYASVERIRRELGACTDGQERAERALELLIEVAVGDAGYLYAVQDGQLALCASSALHTPDARVSRALERFIDEIASCDTDATEVVGADEPVERSRTGAVIVGTNGQVYSAFAIAVERGVEQIVVAVLVLARVAGLCAPLRETLNAVGAELFVRGDLTGLTLLR